MPVHLGTAVLLVAAAVVAAGSARAQLRGTATVIDGDTNKVAGKTVRLNAIDAPETEQPYGPKATRALCRRIGGQPVRVETHGRGR